MRLHIEFPYFKITLFEDGEPVKVRIVDDIIRAMDIVTTFCSVSDPFVHNTALVQLYCDDEIAESWEFDGLTDPIHKVY